MQIILSYTLKIILHLLKDQLAIVFLNYFETILHTNYLINLITFIDGA